MKQKILLLSLLIASSLMFAQSPTIIQQEWVRTYSYQDSIQNTATAIDANGNIVVTGYTYDAVTKSNITTIMYDVAGNMIWVRHYNGASNNDDRATGIIYDSNGNIYVCGFTSNGVTNINYILIKYDSNGNELWTQIYDNGGYDCIKDIAIDNNDNVYITGVSQDAGHNDILTIKLDPNGNAQWLKRKITEGNDFAKSIIVKNNRVYVGGYGMFTNYNYLLISYDFNGIEQYAVSATTGNNDYAQAMTVDNSLNIYLTGYTENLGISEYYTVKFDANGNILWNNKYKDYDNWNKAFSICNDNSGNVYIVGTTIGSNISTITTLKYNPTGDQLWTQKYYTQTQMYKVRARIVCDNTTGIYIGTTAGTTNNDYCTIKYNFDGAEEWVQTYNGTGNGTDMISDLTIDSQNNVYVTGQSHNGNNYDFATIKYSMQDIYIPPDNQIDPPSDSYIFYQNKGQLKDIQNNPRSDLKFYTNACSPKIYLSDTSLSYIFAEIDTIETTIDTLHRVDMKMFRGNETQLQYLEHVPGHLNYYLAHIPEGRTNINGYRRIVAPNIYDNIDLHYYSNSAGFKYYFVVNPGGDDSNIKMQFNGAENVSIQNDNLIIETLLGNIEFEHANVYRINPGGNVVPMPNQGDYYIDNDGNVGFDIHNYPANSTLIITLKEGLSLLSPTAIDNLEWCTYVGGDEWDVAHDLHITKTGIILMCGGTNSIDFPVINGYVVDTVYGVDAYAAVFLPTRIRHWVTFYGGESTEQAYAITADKINNVYIAGYTFSKEFPTLEQTGAYNDATYGDGGGGIAGTPDGFIVKFDFITGGLLWATYFGDTIGSDYINDIAVNSDDELYICGYTTKEVDFPIVIPGNSFERDIIGLQLGFVTRFDVSNQIEWSTLYGGGTASIKNIAIDKAQNVFITGGTGNSLNNLPIVANGGFTQAFGGSWDIMIAKFNPNNEVLWSTFYGGDGYDYGDGLSLSPVNWDIYVTGCVSAATEFPTYSSGAYIDSVVNSREAFLLRFDYLGVRKWATLFGSSGADNGYDVCNDTKSNVYITGYCNSNDIELRSHAGAYFQDIVPVTTPKESFFAMFNKYDELVWSSYFGHKVDGAHTYGKAIAAYKSSKLYIVGETQLDYYYNPDFPLYNPGSGAYYDDENLNYNEDAFIVEFDLTPLVESINETEIVNNGIVIYPNPSDGKISIYFTEKPKGMISIKLYDLSGKIIYRENESMISQTKSIEFNNLSKGGYIS